MASRLRVRHRTSIALAAAFAACPLAAFAQANPSVPNPFIEDIRQHERLDALRAAQEKTIDARLPREGSSEARRLPSRDTMLSHRSRAARWRAR
jgi:hypothetical protein